MPSIVCTLHTLACQLLQCWCDHICCLLRYRAAALLDAWLHTSVVRPVILPHIAALAVLWCSAHEYTQSNAKWAVTVDPNNKKLQQRKELIDSLRSKVGLGSHQPAEPDRLGGAVAACPHVPLHCASGRKGEDTLQR